MEKIDLYKTWVTNKLIAHRGFHDNNSDAPENSLAAFKLAIENNYAMEMDVQMSSDGVLVVFHDDTLNRVCGVEGKICETPIAELKKLHLYNSSQTIPTMEEFLNLVDGRQPLLIEVKDHANIGELEQKLTDMLHNYKGEFIIESFNPFIIKWFYQNAPEFVRGQLSTDFKDNKDLSWIKKYLLRHMIFNKSNHSQFIAYDIRDIKRPQIKRIKKKMPVLAWTVRSPEEIEENREYFDNIIFQDFKPRDIFKDNNK